MKSLLLAFAGIALCATAVFAQDDSTRYIFGIPVDANDTVRELPSHDLAPGNELQRVPPADLPDAIREALKESRYAGWQDSTIYFQVNTGLYIVPIKYEGGVKIFGLNARGKPVTYDEVDRRRNQLK